MPDLIEIAEIFCGRTHVQTDGRTLCQLQSHVTKTRPNIENLAPSNLDIVP